MGLGLFASEHIQQGEPITRYLGRIVYTRTYTGTETHIVRIPETDFGIDGLSVSLWCRMCIHNDIPLPTANLGSMCNSARGTSRRPNARFQWIVRPDRVVECYIVARRDIAPGEEILLNYKPK